MVRNALFYLLERLLLLYLALGFTISQAQEQSASGAASISLAGADLCLKDSWTANYNPAALTSQEKLNFAAAIENGFLIPELSKRAFVLNLPSKDYALALTGQQFGFSDFRQNQFGLAYAQGFGPKFSLGLQFNYHHTQLVDPYGSEVFYTVNLALTTQLSSRLELAALIINPNRANSSEAASAYSPQAINMGLGYKAEEYLKLFLQTEKELGKPLNNRIGAQYSYKKVFDLRMGVSHGPQPFAFGFSYCSESFKVDFGSSYHFELGFSPAVSLSYYPIKHED